MRAQTETALADCDAILFVIDARAGITGTDRHFAAAVRRAGKPIILIANKAEAGRARRRLRGFQPRPRRPDRLLRRARRGPRRTLRRAREALPPAARLDPDEEDEASRWRSATRRTAAKLDPTKPLRIAVLGRPNAGKSTLLNRILGEDRLLTGPEPGITRD